MRARPALAVALAATSLVACVHAGASPTTTARMRVTAKVGVGFGSCGMAYAFGKLWTATNGDNRLVRIDPGLHPFRALAPREWRLVVDDMADEIEGIHVLADPVLQRL